MVFRSVGVRIGFDPTPKRHDGERREPRCGPAIYIGETLIRKAKIDLKPKLEVVKMLRLQTRGGLQVHIFEGSATISKRKLWSRKEIEIDLTAERLTLTYLDRLDENWRQQREGTSKLVITGGLVSTCYNQIVEGGAFVYIPSIWRPADPEIIKQVNAANEAMAQFAQDIAWGPLDYKLVEG